MGSIFKSIFEVILMFLIMILTFIQGLFMYGAYKPSGEIYVKTSSSSGDAGITDVIDFELEKDQYSLDEQINATIGFGYKEGHEKELENFILEIKVISNNKEEVYFEKQIVYNELYSSEKFKTYEEKSYLDFLGHYWYWYPNFYPNYHEIVTIDLPKDTKSGSVYISLIKTNNDDDSQDYNYTFLTLNVRYLVVDGQIIFVVND